MFFDNQVSLIQYRNENIQNCLKIGSKEEYKCLLTEENLFYDKKSK